MEAAAISDSVDEPHPVLTNSKRIARTNAVSCFILFVHRRDHLCVLFQKLRCADVVELILVQRGDLRHLALGERKVEEREIRADVLGILRAGDDDVLSDKRPYESNLICAED